MHAILISYIEATKRIGDNFRKCEMEILSKKEKVFVTVFHYTAIRGPQLAIDLFDCKPPLAHRLDCLGAYAVQAPVRVWITKDEYILATLSNNHYMTEKIIVSEIEDNLELIKLEQEFPLENNKVA